MDIDYIKCFHYLCKNRHLKECNLLYDSGKVDISIDEEYALQVIHT